MAQIDVSRRLADLGQYSPAALAAITQCRRHARADFGDVGKGERIVRDRPRPDRPRRGDAELGQVDASEQSAEPLGDKELDFSLQARPEPLAAPFELEGAGDHAAQIAQYPPTLAERLIAPIGRNIREELEMIFAGACDGRARPPLP